ncbi:VCBS repeat-containing protein, partial [Planktothrix agardhii]|uniref:VCBS repeat-containing protein n=2 Tax=Planktothrix TaxID=54304 RepID=UPI0011D285FE
NISLTGVGYSSVTTADFDNDGDTDILLTGFDSSFNRISKIYSNTLNPRAVSFSKIAIAKPLIWGKS